MPGRSELLADVIIQGAGLLASVIGVSMLVYLTITWADGVTTAAALTYGLTLIGMFICSILNATVRHPQRQTLIRLIDHSVIYLLIAGTYTPFCLLAIGGRRGVDLLIGVWLGALLGVAIRIFLLRRLKGAIVTLYVLLGWSGLIHYDVVIQRLTDTPLTLLGLGGVLYTIGAPVHRWSRLRYHSAIWHSLVVAGAACHYYAILLIMTAFHSQAAI